MNVLAADLQDYLQQSRDSVLRALEDLSEYDIRRPVMPSGTNLLGLVKHLAGVDAAYLGDCLDRPAPFHLPWVEDGSIWDSADMWATADQSRDYIVDLYRAAWAHSNAAIAELPLESPGETIDGRGGRDHDDVGNAQWWDDYVRRIQETAHTFK